VQGQPETLLANVTGAKMERKLEYAEYLSKTPLILGHTISKVSRLQRHKAGIK
jgi:hypothetical protein